MVSMAKLISNHACLRAHHVVNQCWLLPVIVVCACSIAASTITLTRVFMTAPGTLTYTPSQVKQDTDTLHRKGLLVCSNAHY